MYQLFQSTTALSRALPIMALAVLVLPVVAHANPQDGVVAEGAATIVHDGSQLNIHQTTNRAVIDWRSFNIDVGEHTQFHQPSSNSVALNRVRSNDPSVIAGRLSANGNVILVNPNGVYFTPTSRVDVNGLIATTADIANDDFMQGRMRFNQAGRGDARIVQEGEITAGQAGLVGIVAPNVMNHGVIRARTIQLASGDTMAVDLYGDGLLSVAVSDAVRSQLVEHSGRLESNGGVVELTAAAGRQLVDSLIDVRGDIAARAVSEKGGRIIIAAAGTGADFARGHSTVKVSGALDAAGTQAHQAGGSIRISADDVALASTARLNASGMRAVETLPVSAGDEDVDTAAARTAGRAGGDVFIGGGYQGDGSVFASQRTYVAEGAQINVRGAQDGDGGRAIIWSDGATGFRGFVDARGGALGGNGGVIEVSGARQLGYHGAVDASAQNGTQGYFLLDPTDITISNAASSNVTAASPYEPNADNVASNLNVANLVTALATANVTVRTRATGAQAGNITVSDALSWSTNFGLTLDAHNNITVNAPITARNALTFTAGGDVILNANLIEQASGANLTFQPKSAAGTVGIAGGVGTLNLSTADLGFIQNGWNSLIIGNAAGTGAMRVNAHTWNVPTTLRTTTGLISIDGAQNFGANAATIISRNLSINNTLTGTGTLTIRPDTNVTMGIGTGAVGTLQLSDAELDFIQNGWNSLSFGLNSSSQALNVNARTWQDHVTFTSRTGLITIAGAQNTLGNNMTITTRNLNVNNTLSGTGTLTIRPEGNTTMGVGTGAVGTLQLSDAELDFIQNGWGNLAFGLTNSTAAMNVNARTWQDSVTFATSTGLLTIAGAQNVGANNLTIATRNLTLNNTLSGTGTLTIRPEGNTTMGVGTGAVGTLQLSNGELDFIQDGWGNRVFGLTSSTAALNVNARTWSDSVTFATSTGALTIAGAQNVGANNLTIATRNLVLNGDLIGTGTLAIRPEGNTTMGIAGAVGVFQLTNAMLDRIATTWSNLVFGSSTSTAALNANARNWNSNVTFVSDTGVVSINGAQNMGSNNLTLQTDTDVVINAPLTGTGVLNVRANNNAASTYTIGAAGGNIALTVSDLNNITDGWSLISIGTPDVATTAAMTLSAYTWQDDVAIYNDTGAITVSGAQNFGGNDFAITSRGNVTFNAAVNGTGTLSFIPELNNSTVRVGGTGGNLNIVAASIPNIGSGWGEVLIGRNDGTGAMTFNGANSWNAPVRAISNTGIVAVSAAQNFGANNFTIETNANPGITANISGTGNFTLRALNGTSSIGLGGAGTLNLTSAEIGFLQAGWNQLVFGANSASSAITFGTANWLSPVLATTTGNITLASAFSSALNSGTAFTMAALGGANITNSAGAGAITTAGARWLMYADDIGDVTLGALTRDFNRYSCAYIGGCAAGVSIPAAGNGVVYGVTPVLSFAGLAVNTRTYDGTNAATLDFSGASVLGAQAGDVLSLDTASGTTNFADAQVGAGKAVTVAGLALTGANMGYAITQPVGLTGEITKANFRVAADSLNAPAGSSPSFTFTYQLADLFGGDTLGTIGLTGAPAVVGAAGIPALAAGSNFTLSLNLGGLTSTNYNFTEFLPRGVLTLTAAPVNSNSNTLPPTVLATSQFMQSAMLNNSQIGMTTSENSNASNAKRTIEWIEIMKGSGALRKSGLLFIDNALQILLPLQASWEI